MLIPLEQNNNTDGFFVDSATGKHGYYVRGVKIFEVPADGSSLTILKNLILHSSDALAARLPFYIGKASGVDTDGRNGGLAGCDQVLDVTLAEAAATLALVWDDSAEAFAQLSAVSDDDFVQYQIFPDNTQDDDALYLGHTLKWCQAFMDMSATVQTYTDDALVWEYWDGSAWVALTLFDYTDATAQDGLRSFGRDGSLHFVPPADWAATAVNGTTGVWIRVKAGTAANLSAIGITNSKRHQLCSPTDGIVVPQTGTVTALALRDAAGTAHTTADVIFFLFNFTTGAHTAALTFPMDKRNDRWTGLTLAVAAGDVLGLVVQTEDGAAEIGPAAIELDVTLSLASS